MRDYGKRRRDREPMTRELYGLGLSCEEIAYTPRSSRDMPRSSVRKVKIGDRPMRSRQRCVMF